VNLVGTKMGKSKKNRNVKHVIYLPNKKKTERSEALAGK